SWMGIAGQRRPPQTTSALTPPTSGQEAGALRFRVPLTAPTFEHVVRWGAQLTVKDSPEVITVTPLVTVEENGGYLVADAREAQIRSYSPTGELLVHFGRQGQGPGEFTSLSGLVRLSGDQILASDMGGKLTTFTNTGRVLRTDAVPLTPLYGIARLNDSTIILLGRSEGDGPVHLLHLWDLKTHKLRHSFFPEPAHRTEFDDAYRFSGFPTVSVRGGRIAAMFALDPRIRIFDEQGRQTEVISVPFRDFRQLPAPTPPSGSPEAFQRWVESFSVISRIVWTDDGSFFVQYFDKVGREPQWKLLHMSGRGERRFEGPSPKLLTAVSSNQLLFDAPDSDEPNVWQFASIPDTPGD
ncbi:MAG TPA: hypothetical protein VFS20_06165, partial [Longimicrobium sp.]|nr:hypothetical protein [Longimicrobium sp.]